MKHVTLGFVGLVLLIGLAAADDAVTASGPAGLLAQMRQRLAEGRQAAPADSKLKYHEVLSLASRLEREYPGDALAGEGKDLQIDALLALRSLGDAAGSDAAIGRAGLELRTLAGTREFQAKAEYVLLGVEMGLRLPQAASTQPVALTPSQAATRLAMMREFIPRYRIMAQEFSGTAQAPVALYSAGLLAEQAGMNDQAISALENLSAEYPGNRITLDGLQLLATVYERLDRPAEALKAKSRLVELFPDTPAAAACRGDILRSQRIGKLVALRLRSLDGTLYDLTRQTGRESWLYFVESVGNDAALDDVSAALAGLRELAVERRARLIVVSRDSSARSIFLGDLVRGRGWKEPVLLDSRSQWVDQLGLNELPCLVLLDEKGRLTRFVMGPGIAGKLAGSQSRQ